MALYPTKPARDEIYELRGPDVFEWDSGIGRRRGFYFD